MIRYLLDTDVISQASKSRPNANVMAWLASVNDDELSISAITVRERWKGAERAGRARSPHFADIAADVETMVTAFEGRILPIHKRAARIWAALLVPDSSKPDDKAQIAVAVANGLTLVSLNATDIRGRGAAVLNPGRKPPKLYPA